MTFHHKAFVSATDHNSTSLKYKNELKPDSAQQKADKVPKVDKVYKTKYSFSL